MAGKDKKTGDSASATSPKETKKESFDRINAMSAAMAGILDAALDETGPLFIGHRLLSAGGREPKVSANEVLVGMTMAVQKVFNARLRDRDMQLDLMEFCNEAAYMAHSFIFAYKEQIMDDTPGTGKGDEDEDTGMSEEAMRRMAESAADDSPN